jgi:ubiquinone/menaquinone biosynthesis C-methylase UbiE
MLLLLEQHELMVSELCAVLQLPQSTVSRHLKTLADAEWVASRRDGTSRYYSLSENELGGHFPLWELTRKEIEGRPGTAHDRRRLERVLAERRETSRQFFASSAGQWDRLRDELFGGDFYLRALLGLLDPESTIADLGCGTGAVSAALAPNVKKVIGVDASDEMLTAAADRFRQTSIKNVTLKQGTLEAVPLDRSTVDAAMMMLVLHHLPSPALALAEAARLLKPGGRLLIVDMAPHEREDYKKQMGHVWLGFSDEHMRRLLSQAGFTNVKIHALPEHTAAKGPGLFVATGRTIEPGFSRAD